MGPEGLVPSLLVYGVVPSFPAINTKLPNQRERMNALSLARREMAAITARLRIQRALGSRLPPATEYDVSPGDDVYVFREKSKRWYGPYTVIKRRQKEVFVNINGDEMQFNVSQVLPDSRDVVDHELDRLHNAMEEFKSNPPPGIFVTEVLHPSDPRGRSPLFDVAKCKELQGLAARGVYELVWKEDLPKDANILGGRFVLSIKNKDSDKEVYKARFVVQGHTDAEKNILVHSGTLVSTNSEFFNKKKREKMWFFRPAKGGGSLVPCTVRMWPFQQNYVHFDSQNMTCTATLHGHDAHIMHDA